MNKIIVILGSIFAVLSSVIISYISIATMIGPWIAPTVVLVSGLLLRMLSARNTENLTLIQTMGSVGGIIGMAVGFTLPTLFFLDKNLFNSLLASPIYFSFLMMAVTLAAGSVGIFFANLLSERFIKQEQLNFPVSQLIFKGIKAQDGGTNVRGVGEGANGDLKSMMFGFSLTAVFCAVRDGFIWFSGLLPKTIYLFQTFLGKPLLGKEFAIALFPGPTLWAIGFTSGALITIPLLVGVISKYLVLYPINHHSEYFSFSLFSVMSEENFTMAFCGGMVVAEVIFGLGGYYKIIWQTLKNFSFPNLRKNSPGELTMSKDAPKDLLNFALKNKGAVVAFLSSMAFLSFLDFSLMSQIFMLVLMAIATYHMSYLAARIGIAPFGRYATFVMVPTLFLFKLSFLQVTFLCVFFNICAGVACDLLFSYKVGELSNVDLAKIRRYQLLGIIVSAIFLGLFLWLLFTTYEIGSAELCAQRGKSRALLIQSTSFDPWVLAIGFLFGWIVKQFNINPAMILGGLLSPNTVSIGLILGGLSSKLFKQPENYAPFWSGVFACESLCILLGMLTSLIR